MPEHIPMPKAPDGFVACRTGSRPQVTHLVILDSQGSNGGRPTMCRLTRFPILDPHTREVLLDADLPGWGMGDSGVTGPAVQQVKCPGCWDRAAEVCRAPDAADAAASSAEQRAHQLDDHGEVEMGQPVSGPNTAVPGEPAGDTVGSEVHDSTSSGHAQSVCGHPAACLTDRDGPSAGEDGPECETCGRTTCPDAQLVAFSEPVDCEYAPIYEALHAAKDCDYGCARDLTNAGIRQYVVPAVDRIVETRVDEAVAAALIVGSARAQHPRRLTDDQRAALVDLLPNAELCSCEAGPHLVWPDFDAKVDALLTAVDELLVQPTPTEGATP
ncbi:hypothetical protein [Nocardioides sp. L-11A]|uniref:hypothetical protein n=1 Tax=Nocardioides sp. L-11A TaxID=3043848 RepID=UPI00249BD076|nr:hypothetical protein QJ852_09920 [Nocardioides sp. L-11A]